MATFRRFTALPFCSFSLSLSPEPNTSRNWSYTTFNSTMDIASKAIMNGECVRSRVWARVWTRVPLYELHFLGIKYSLNATYVHQFVSQTNPMDYTHKMCLPSRIGQMLEFILLISSDLFSFIWNFWDNSEPLHAPMCAIFVASFSFGYYFRALSFCFSFVSFSFIYTPTLFGNEKLMNLPGT